MQKLCPFLIFGLLCSEALGMSLENNRQFGTFNTTISYSSTYKKCMGRCPVPLLYSPICGSDRVTYKNRWHLGCAKNCGKRVNQAKVGACHATTTVAPPAI